VHTPATEEPAIFHYEQGWQPIADEARPDLATRRHSAREITWASAGDNGQPGFTVKADYYRSETPGMHPLVIVLPLWGTYTYPPQKIAEGVRDRGRGEYHVLRVLGENYLFDWDSVAASTDRAMLYERAAQMSERMRVTVIDVRRLIDWAQQQPEIDPQRIGLVGFSMSAIVGGLVAGADDRLGAAVLVMGGANLHDIIATCDGPLERVRETVLPRLDLTQEQYHAIVEEAWGWLNPTHFPTRIDPSRILYFDAQRDECMSQEARDAFWEALGEPRRVSFHYGHKHSFLAMTPLGLNYMRRVIYRFIDRTLAQVQ
jgi:dienelactone hydrolase